MPKCKNCLLDLATATLLNTGSKCGNQEAKNNNGNEIFKTSFLIKKSLMDSYALEKYPE